MSTAIFSANNIKMNLRQQIVRKRNTWDCLRDLYSSRLLTLKNRICDLFWDNWDYHKKFRDNEPQGASTSLHDRTRAVIPTVRTREPIATFRPIFPRLDTKPYNESSTACKRFSRSEHWVLGHVNHFCCRGQGQIYYFSPHARNTSRKYEPQSSFTFSRMRLSKNRTILQTGCGSYIWKKRRNWKNDRKEIKKI